MCLLLNAFREPWNITGMTSYKTRDYCEAQFRSVTFSIIRGLHLRLYGRVLRMRGCVCRCHTWLDHTRPGPSRQNLQAGTTLQFSSSKLKYRKVKVAQCGKNSPRGSNLFSRAPEAIEQLQAEKFIIENGTFRTGNDDDNDDVTKTQDMESLDVLISRPFDIPTAISEPGDFPINANRGKPKKILIWNEAYGTTTYGFGSGRGPFVRAGCRVDTCFMTANRSLTRIQDFDAIIFHFRSTEKKDLPTARSPHQRWVFYETESASYIYQDPAIYNFLFNWTFTYRHDSDIVFRYGKVKSIQKTRNNVTSVQDYSLGKTRLAAWFVSHCSTRSGRERYVMDLKEHIKIDVYGKCGPYQCSRKNQTSCYKMAAKKYKFYLSFENSLCLDYVTEKFFSILRYDLVPVVFGLGKYEHLAPPHSYINALKFKDAEALAKYLLYLDSNNTAYNEYFGWKGSYVLEDDWATKADSFCSLCAKLHDDPKPKIYEDLRKWFVFGSECKTVRPRTQRAKLYEKFKLRFA
ncbi:alpha-(1,3)-fucosyltransferase C-like [Oratosquilla oratoria]|uniref:alpha-(1,3)-fucosyltransferase C-like n=1 Tax=Oratosquilla oratoria TaxID=337810 RepID=UPI003F76B9C8